MTIILLKSGKAMEVANFYDELCEKYGANFDEEKVISDDIFDDSEINSDFDFEKFMKTEPLVSKRQQKKEKEAENLKTLKKWYDLPRQEITEDVKVFATRHAWDPKRFYKGEDRSKQTEYFQRGSIENSAFNPSTAVPRQNKNTDVLDNLLESEALKKKLKKADQIRKVEQNQKAAAKRKIEKRKNRKSERTDKEHLQPKKNNLKSRKNKAKK